MDNIYRVHKRRPDCTLVLPLFRPFRAETALTVRAVQTIVMRRAAAVGVDSASGHSLRVGSAQSLAARGATLPELQAVGRWADPAMPGRYCRAQSAGRSAVARLRGD